MSFLLSSFDPQTTAVDFSKFLKFFLHVWNIESILDLQMDLYFINGIYNSQLLM